MDGGEVGRLRKKKHELIITERWQRHGPGVLGKKNSNSGSSSSSSTTILSSEATAIAAAAVATKTPPTKAATAATKTTAAAATVVQRIPSYPVTHQPLGELPGRPPHLRTERGHLDAEELEVAVVDAEVVKAELDKAAGQPDVQPEDQELLGLSTSCDVFLAVVGSGIRLRVAAVLRFLERGYNRL